MSDTLTAESVSATFARCSTVNGDVVIEGIKGIARFDKGALADHAEMIAWMLLELPDQFRASAGGGWSFLNACDDRHGNQWTGLHATMEMLFMLGLAVGMVKLMLPRDMWEALPGGMPYYVVVDRRASAAEPSTTTAVTP